jgi:hypothetical protein
MKIKTLLLGSAAALLVTGGAQAADLSIAESVEYVRVCDAFGVGYWYIPGTDTCIKIGGFVQFDLKFQSAGWNFGDGDSVSHSSHWKFVTEAGVNFTAKSMTEYGALVGADHFPKTSAQHLPGLDLQKFFRRFVDGRDDPLLVHRDDASGDVL